MAMNEIEEKDAEAVVEVPAHQEKARRQWIACVVIVAMIASIGLMLYATDGWMNRGYGIAFFTATALITGIAFWTLTPGNADDSIDLKDLGIRLGGGAAIGAAFAILAWKFVPSDGGYTVVSLPSTVTSIPSVVSMDDRVKDVAGVNGRRWLVVELRSGADEGVITLRWLDDSAENPVVRQMFTVRRNGEISYHDQ